MAINDTRIIGWADEAACASTARALASSAALRRAFIELRGPLGAGKTTFVRHLLQALGVKGRIKSPTYAVMEPYGIEGTNVDADAIADAGAWQAWHFDFYRFNDPREWEDAGFRDIFASAGLKLAEWPEQAEGLLPVPDLRIDISPVPVDGEQQDDARMVNLTTFTPLGVELMESLA